MTGYLVEVRREHGAWRVAVPELGIVSHTHTLHRAGDVASRLIAQLLGVPADSFQVVVSRQPGSAGRRNRS